MLRLLALILALTFYGSPSIAGCNYCTSLADALDEPERAVELDLRAEGMHVIPESINELINLVSLDLSSNLIESIDFKSIRLPSLVNLNLSNNPGFNTMQLAGIEKSFPNLRTLKLSSVSARYLSADLAGLKWLEELNLSQNSIEYLPEGIGKMSSLKSLDVSQNRLQDVYWLTGLWKIEQLDISGNPEIDLESVGMALFLKENLKSLAVTSYGESRSLPNSFAQLNLEELSLKSGKIHSLNMKLARSETIKKIVLDEVEIMDGDRFVDWLNRFKGLSSIEYRNMVVPRGLDEVAYIREMKFVNATFEKKTELKSVRKEVNMIAIGTNISAPGYLGNAKVAVETQSEITRNENVDLNDEMRENKLEPIVKSRAQVLKIDGKSAQRVSMDFSSYDIPSEAFLTQNGQIYTGEVELRITEYKDPIENALAGVPMIYRTEEKNNIFASSGMIDFRALDEQGNELMPNPAKLIQVEIKDLQPSESPDLYVFNEGTGNWDRSGLVRPSGFARNKQQWLDSLNKLPDSEFANFKQVPIGLLMSVKKSRLDPYTLSFDVVGKTSTIKTMKDFQDQVYTGNVDQRWVARKNSWHIDTSITPEIKELLKNIKKDQNKTSAYWSSKRKDAYVRAPRIVRDLRLSPNLDHDNFTMQFNYRDSAYAIPVSATYGGSIRTIQNKERRNYLEYERKVKEARTEQELIDRYVESVVAAQAKLVREQRATFLANNPEYVREREEYLRFGMESFGLVNCDYFSRNIPDEYVTLDTVAVDENGNTVQVPKDIRSIYLDDNSFVSTDADNFPIFNQRKSIILFALGAFEVAVIKGWNKLKNGLSRPNVVRISTEGLSPAQVKEKILSLE